jgi:competence protein ComGC
MQTQKPQCSDSQAFTEHHMKIVVLFIVTLLILLGCIWTIQDRFHELNKRISDVETRLLLMETKSK